MQKEQKNRADIKSVTRYIQWQFFIKYPQAATTQVTQDSNMGDQIVLSITNAKANKTVGMVAAVLVGRNELCPWQA